MFYEDERIVRKNRKHNEEAEQSEQVIKLILEKKVVLSDMVTSLKEMGYKVTLADDNTIVIG